MYFFLWNKTLFFKKHRNQTKKSMLFNPFPVPLSSFYLLTRSNFTQTSVCGDSFFLYFISKTQRIHLDRGHFPYSTLYFSILSPLLNQIYYYLCLLFNLYFKKFFKLNLNIIKRIFYFLLEFFFISDYWIKC